MKNEIISKIREMLDYCDEVRYTGQSSEMITQEELVASLEKLINTRGWRK